ncbi:MAG: FixH family protein [Flavobacteriia bacterium]|nr:FixH family protein [Flavobacteriia bacterium]
MKIKFNWGHGITLFLLCFIGFIATLVYGTFQQRVDLTSEDYYAQEVAYDEEKRAIENGLKAGEVDLIKTTNNLEVVLPEGDWSKINIKLLRPDNADLDVENEIENPEFNSINISRPTTVGLWNVEVVGESQGEIYRWEFKDRF